IWFGPINYVEVAGFVGATTMVLAVVALAARRRLRTAPGLQGFAWGLTCSGILLVYVGGAPLRLLQTTPGLAELFGSNHIGRFKSVLGLGFAMLATLGLQALLHRDGPLVRRRTRLVLALAGVTAAVLLALAYAQRVPPGAGAYVWRQAALPLGALVAAVAAVVWARRVRPGRGATLAVVLLPALFAVEALAFTLPYWARVPPDQFYPETSAHAAARNVQGTGRLAAEHRTMYPGTTTAYGLRSVTAHAFVAPEWADLLEQVDPQAFERGASQPVVRGPTFPHLRGNIEVVRSPVLDRLAVHAFATPPWQPPFGPITEVVPPDGPGAPLPAGTAATVDVPNLPLRGVVVDLHAPFTGSSGRAFLRVEVVDDAGTVLTHGRRRLWPGAPEPPLLQVADARVTGPHTGPFVIAIPEVHPDGGASLHVRLWLDAPDGAVELTSGPDGRTALALVQAVDDGLRLVHTEGAQVWQRLTALDRFRWASRVAVIPEPAARLEALATRLPADTVVLSAPAPLQATEEVADQARIDVIEPDGDRLRVRVDAARAGYLVVADALQHGWGARVDGEPAELLDADHALVAILVPAGQHDVMLAYEPPGWVSGMKISSAALVVIAALLVLEAARRYERPLLPWSHQGRDQVGEQAGGQ
ncbi:MAG TPA: hypothetical protein VGA69_11435, partial [Nitriliruptorales bacterium]